MLTHERKTRIVCTLNNVSVVFSTYINVLFTGWVTLVSVIAMVMLGTWFIVLQDGFMGWPIGLAWFAYAGSLLVFKVQELQQQQVKVENNE